MRWRTCGSTYRTFLRDANGAGESLPFASGFENLDNPTQRRFEASDWGETGLPKIDIAFTARIEATLTIILSRIVAMKMYIIASTARTRIGK